MNTSKKAGFFYGDTNVNVVPPVKLNGAKVLVTGGAGFIGSNLVRQLLREKATVVVIDNLWRGKLSNLESINGFNLQTLKTKTVLKRFSKST